MKTTKTLTLIALALFLNSCNDSDTITLLDVESETVSNLHAPQVGGQGQPISGEFTKFDFETGEITTSETDWDIAFRSTAIIVNGGSSLGTTDEPDRTSSAGIYIASGTMTTVTEANVNLFTQDSSNGYAIPAVSDQGWYNYSGAPNYLITPLAGKIIVVRTSDGKYAKMEIVSYYENAPEDPNAFTDASRYYTFRYVYQPNDGVTTFE